MLSVYIVEVILVCYLAAEFWSQNSLSFIKSLTYISCLLTLSFSESLDFENRILEKMFAICFLFVVSFSIAIHKLS